MMTDARGPVSSTAERDDHAASPAKVSSLFVTLYALAMTGTWLAILTPIIVTLPLKVREIAAGDEAGALSLVLGVGAILAMVGNPLFGKLSDQTAGGIGMRRPWIIGGVVFGALGAAIAAFAPSVPILLLGWCVMQLALNATLAGLTAVLADKVPHIQRGSVSGILGMCLPLGQVAGTYLAQTISGLTLMFLLPAVAGMIMVVVFGVYLPDRRMEPGVRPRESLAAWIAKFWVNPKAAPDFAWAWCSRFTFILGLAFVLTYQALFLLNKLHYSAEELPHLLFVSTSVSAATVAIASIVGGKLSDLFQRRKIFVGVSAAGYGIGLWVIAASPDFNGFLVGMAIAGLAQGVYLAVDLALVTEVLPAGQVDTAKNMGLFNIANALPQSLAPAIAPAILLAGKGNYSWLFVAAGMSSVIGALLIWPVRGAR